MKRPIGMDWFWIGALIIIALITIILLFGLAPPKTPFIKTETGANGEVYVAFARTPRNETLAMEVLSGEVRVHHGIGFLTEGEVVQKILYYSGAGCIEAEVKTTSIAAHWSHTMENIEPVRVCGP